MLCTCLTSSHSHFLMHLYMIGSAKLQLCFILSISTCKFTTLNIGNMNEYIRNKVL